MTRNDDPRDTERLPEDAARRILARASELEAAGSDKVSVAELREAARAAGIAPDAFEQALAELRGREPALVEADRGPVRLRLLTRVWPAAVAGVLALAVLGYVVMRLFP